MGNKPRRDIKRMGKQPHWLAPKPYGSKADQRGRKGKLK